MFSFPPSQPQQSRLMHAPGHMAAYGGKKLRRRSKTNRCPGEIRTGTSFPCTAYMEGGSIIEPWLPDLSPSSSQCSHATYLHTVILTEEAASIGPSAQRDTVFGNPLQREDLTYPTYVVTHLHTYQGRTAHLLQPAAERERPVTACFFFENTHTISGG
jgi:hypothetical protein